MGEPIMRTAIASLILAAGLAGGAAAQTPPPAAPAPAAPATPAASSPPAAVAPPAAPAPAAQPAPEPPPLPAMPTSGDGAQVIQALEKICVPAVRGQGLDAVAKANGLKQNRRDETWTMPLGS